MAVAILTGLATPCRIGWAFTKLFEVVAGEVTQIGKPAS